MTKVKKKKPLLHAQYLPMIHREFKSMHWLRNSVPQFVRPLHSACNMGHILVDWWGSFFICQIHLYIKYNLGLI